MKYVLTTNNLTKIYKTTLGRETRAVDNLNIKIKKGSIFGFLGPNGSGKTTTLAMLLSVVNPSSGNFIWFNDKNHNNARKKIGAILEGPNFYPSLSAYDNLKIVSFIKKINKEKIDEVLKVVNLYDRKNDKFKVFSLGMKQRLSIASALLSEPEVLVLDEPTNGLDPKGIADIRKLIVNISKTGKTVILASHLLDEVQKVCSEFIVLKKGKLIKQGMVNENFSSTKNLKISSSDLEKLKDIVAKHDHFISLKEINEKLEVVFKADSDINKVSKFIYDNGIIINHFELITKTLEDRFLNILEEND